MKILILNQAFYPDVVSTAQHAADAAAALAAEGHTVTVVASRRAYDSPSTVFPAREAWNGCEIRRVRSAGLGRNHRWHRLVDSVTLLAAFFFELARLPRFDVVIAMTHPPLISVLAALAVRIKGGRLVSWVMDLNPDQAIAAGWLRAGSAAERLLSGALVFSLRASARIVVLDRRMRERIERKGAPPAKIEVLPPWSHAHVRYDPAGRAAFRAAHGLEGRFVVMHAGNLSIVHPVSTLLEAAERLRGRPDIVFCFVGGGPGREAVASFAAARRLRNIRLLPYEPGGGLAAMLSAADLHAIVMGEGMPGIVHPCKLYNVMAVGSPFLYIGPAETHVAEISSGLRGALRAPHGDAVAAAAAIEGVASDGLRNVPEILEASRPFSADVLLSRFTALVSQVTASAPATAAGDGAISPLTEAQ